MPFPITPAVHVQRDEQNRVRVLEHSQQPFSPDATDLAEVIRDEAIRTRVLTTIRSDAALAADAGGAGPAGAGGSLKAVADAYLYQVADVFEIPQAELAGLNDAPTAAPTASGRELRFKEEKRQGGAGVVAYDQTQYGLPVYEAGVSVVMDAAQRTVIGSNNQLDYSIDSNAPNPGAEYVPQKIDVGTLARLLGTGEQPRINSSRQLIYRYLESERLDPHLAEHDQPDTSTGFAGTGSPPYPHLDYLPAVDASITDGSAYIVTEVLFSARDDRQHSLLNWRCFIETRTGSVLYLRPLVACVAGCHFFPDPVTTSGQALSSASLVADLDAQRLTVTLQQLDPPVFGSQSLTGKRISIQDIEAPTIVPPVRGTPYDFSVSSLTDDFAACCAYHNCESVYAFIEGIGVDMSTYFDGTSFPVPVDAQALSDNVNAQARGNATANGMGAFVFGRTSPGGKMGIAADARVVWHEFGHALLWDHVSSPNFGFAHSAGDTLGALMFDPESLVRGTPERWETFPFMNNSAGLSRRHDRLPANGWAWGGANDDTQYKSEQNLSSTLFRIYQLAGGDNANDVNERKWAARYVAALVIKAIALLSRMTRDPVVYVNALIQTDQTHGVFEGHPGGAFRKILRWSFEKQGLYQAPGTPHPIAGPGLPPEVDVYIQSKHAEDGALKDRNGEYDPYVQNFRGFPAVWNRQAADGGITNQPLVAGQPNFVYVKIGNRGVKTATNIQVKGYKQQAATPREWPTDWTPLDTPAVSGPSSLAPNAFAVVGPFSWTPVDASTELLFAVEALGDNSNLTTITAGPILTERLVRLDNNLAQWLFSTI